MVANSEKKIIFDPIFELKFELHKRARLTRDDRHVRRHVPVQRRLRRGEQRVYEVRRVEAVPLCKRNRGDKGELARMAEIQVLIHLVEDVPLGRQRCGGPGDQC